MGKHNLKAHKRDRTIKILRAIRDVIYTAIVIVVMLGGIIIFVVWAGRHPYKGVK